MLARARCCGSARRCCCREKVLVERLGGGSPVECLARPAVERGSDRGEVFSGVSCEVCALREVLAEQAVGVLVGPSLPGALRITEIHSKPAVDRELCVLCHLRTLVPGKRSAELLGQSGDLTGDGVAHRLGATASQRWPVLD